MEESTKPFTGVATGWHGWTMSRGPGAKGAPERDKKKKNKKMKNRKEKEKEGKKREDETFKYPDGGGGTRCIPMSLGR